MADPYGQDSQGLPHTNFEEEVRRHTTNGYQVMVDDGSDADALRREALGLVNPQQEQEMLAKYVDRSEDELDFN